MSIKISGTDVVDNNRKGIFQSANVGTFANPARPVSASTGDLIWSTTDNQLQVWNGSAWVAAVGAGAEIVATGGNATFTPGNGTKVHVFTGPGTFTLSNPSAAVEYFIQAGGGGGTTGGGGAGGALLAKATWNAGSYTITVGSGGSAGAWPTVATNGSPSSISGPSASLTAIGGGAGGGIAQSGSPGGCGGGGGWQRTGGPGPNTPYPGGSGTPGQGYPGASASASNYGAPGGGVGDYGINQFAVYPPQSLYNAAVNNPQVWVGGTGIGVQWDIPSSYGAQGYGDTYGTRWFGGGGNWPYFNPQQPGSEPQPAYIARKGGVGGGGYASLTNRNGFTNTGGGGAGSNGPFSPPTSGGSGGSGIVIIRYSLVQ